MGSKYQTNVRTDSLKYPAEMRWLKAGDELLIKRDGQAIRAHADMSGERGPKGAYQGRNYINIQVDIVVYRDSMFPNTSIYEDEGWEILVSGFTRDRIAYDKTQAEKTAAQKAAAEKRQALTQRLLDAEATIARVRHELDGF